MDMDAPCVLARERPARPGDERFHAKPSEAPLNTLGQTFGEPLGQAQLAHLLLRALDRVFDAVEAGPPAGLQQQVGGPRVAVARLSDRAGI
jgi:hypothetical protein